ncbi:MAG: GNAT family N-acetyltransferase [Breznakibacter sp.]
MPHPLTSKHYSIVSTDAGPYAEDFKKFPGSIFIDPVWIKSMSTDSCQPIYLNLISDRGTEAILGGLVVNGNRLQGTQLYFFSGPAFAKFSNEMYRVFLHHLKIFAIKNRYARISIRPWDQTPNVPVRVLGFVQSSTHEYVIDLGMEGFECQISSRVMKNIKKGTKAGAFIRESASVQDLDLLLSFLDSTKGRRISKFGTVYSAFYMFNLNRESILTLLNRGMAKLLCAEVNGETYSVLLLVYSKDRVCCLLKGSRTEAYANGLSSFIDFKEVQLLRGQGYRWLNLGPELCTKEGQGLNQYKEGICARSTERFGMYTYYLFFPYRILNGLMLLGHYCSKIKWFDGMAQKVSHLFAPAKN